MLCLCMGFWAMHLALLLGCFHGVGTDDGLYFQLQMEAGVPDSAGVSEGDLAVLDEALAEYLKGDEDRLNLSVEVFGQFQPAFNDRELAHMADCLNLFNLLRAVWKIAVIAGVLALAAGLWLRRGRGLSKAFFIGLGLLLIPAGTLALWAATDFTAAFNFFHRVLFTNDLWLLNPSTDLLIRICPESMFAAMGAGILRGWLFGEVWILLAVFLVGALIRRHDRRAMR